MARYDTPVEVRPLERLILGFSSECGRNPMTVFEDFLTYVIHGFSPGVPPLKSWKYKGKQNAAFMRMSCEWLTLMKSTLDGGKKWYDALGELYMSFSSTSGRSAQGQFFTPPPVCDLMVACTANNGNQQGSRVSDPTCGSGRLLLAYHVRNLGLQYARTRLRRGGGLARQPAARYILGRLVRQPVPHPHGHTVNKDYDRKRIQKQEHNAVADIAAERNKN